MTRLPDLVNEINAALEIYLSARTGQQYNRTAYILCDDAVELASKLFLIRENAKWSDAGSGKPYKSFRDVTAEVRSVFKAKRAQDAGAVNSLLDRIEARRDRRNAFFHSAQLLDLNLHARSCVEAFVDLLDYGKLLFPTDWDSTVDAAGNMETCEALVRLDKKTYDDPSVGPKVNDILARWPRTGPHPRKKGCQVTHHAEDMHLRLAIRNGGNSLRDRLRALL